MQKLYKLLAAVFTALFVLSSVVTGTLAWSNLGQAARNDLAGESEAVMAVELVKLEKQQDGTLTKTPVEGAAFALFTKDGGQIGTIYTSDEEGRIPVSLPAGSYYFQEIYPSHGFDFDQDKDGEPKTRYPFTITGEETETVKVKAYNIRSAGSLTLRKIVEREDGAILEEEQAERLFTFTVTFSDEGTYTYSIDNGRKKELESGESLQLKHGQTAVFEGIPTGVQYEIVETPAVGYASRAEGHQGSITKDGCTAVFTNTYAPGSPSGELVISKEIKELDGDIDEDRQFAFEITFSYDEEYPYRIVGEDDKTIERHTLKSGEILLLKHGQKAVFDELPLGMAYTVAEREAVGYTPLTESYAGVITTESITLPFVNVHGSPVDEKGSLTLLKEITGEDPDLDKVFTFEVTIDGKEPQTVQLKAGESHVIGPFSRGTKYEVKEADADGYLPETETVSGSIIGGENTPVVFRNHVPDREPAVIQVTKKVTGKPSEDKEEDKDKEFDFTLTLNGKETDFTLKDGETKEFDAYAGDAYEVREKDYSADGYIQSIENGAGVIGGSDKTIQVIAVNEIEQEEMVELHGEKKWELGDEGDKGKLPDSITVRLKYGDTAIAEQEVKADKDGKWKYSFTAPRFDADGKEIAYTVEEEPVKDFKTEYDGMDITNIYAPEPIVNVKLPAVEKVVTGSGAPKTRFTFSLTARDGAPLPEGSAENAKLISIDGSGTAEFGGITFKKPGVYRYIIKEVDSGGSGWIYDGSEYALTVTVTDKDGKLAAETELTKDGQKAESADKIRFTNRYRTHVPVAETVKVSGTKNWDLGKYTDNAQMPDAIIVYVYGDGELVAQRQVTKQDGWKYSFELPRYGKDGKEIVYTVDEAKIEGFTCRIDGYDITNTYTGTQEPGDPTKPDKPTDPTKPEKPKPDKPAQSHGGSASQSGGKVKTGDVHDLAFWITSMAAELLGLVIVLTMERRHRKGKSYKWKHAK